MSSQPESMDKAASTRSKSPQCELPEEIFIWEILVRLPPKAVLRCRAVCRAWRRATSARDFLLAHDARQPSLPLLYIYNSAGDDGRSIDIIPFDHRAGLADQLQPVARLRYPNASPTRMASCDGILIISSMDMNFTICNPVTRQYAPLHQIDGFRLLGMYIYNPTSEYRLLLYPGPRLVRGELAHGAQNGSYVFPLGAGQPPRHIGYPDAEELIYIPKSFMFHGNFHWYMSHTIMALDTTTETFRQMRAPDVHGRTELFAMNDMMGMSSFSEAPTVIDIWVLQDYEAEEWVYKCRVELPIAELRVQFNCFDSPWYVEAASSCYGDVFWLVKFGERLLHLDINGKLVASFSRKGLHSTQLRIKQTLVSHTFFPTQEDYVVNASPFI